MPEAVHRELQREAQRKIKTRGKPPRQYRTVEQRRRAYVYGGMRRTGWKPKAPGTHRHGSGLS